MKRIFQFRNPAPVHFNFVILMVAVLFNSCEPTDETPDDTCGDQLQWYTALYIDQDYQTHEAVQGTADHVTYYFENLNVPEDICPDNHPLCTWTVETPGGTEDTSLVIIKGRAYWKGLQGEVVKLEWNGNQYRAVKEVGLKMAYQNQPAWVSMNLQVTIRDQGSDSLNRAFLKSKISHMQVQIDYDQYK